MNKEEALKYLEEMSMSRTSFCLNKLSTNKEIEKVNNAVNSIKQSFNAPTPTADEIEMFVTSYHKVIMDCKEKLNQNDFNSFAREILEMNAFIQKYFIIGVMNSE